MYRLSSPLENNSCNLHRHDFQHSAAGHQKEPDFPCPLCFGDGRDNSGNDNDQRADTADDGGYADKRENSRRAASVNSVLNGFVQSVPRRCEAADHKSKNKQKHTPASPILNARTVHERIADIAQQGKNHHRRDGCSCVSKIKFHGFSSSLKFSFHPNFSNVAAGNYIFNSIFHHKFKRNSIFV